MKIRYLLIILSVIVPIYLQAARSDYFGHSWRGGVGDYRARCFRSHKIHTTWSPFGWGLRNRWRGWGWPWGWYSSYEYPFYTPYYWDYK